MEENEHSESSCSNEKADVDKEVNDVKEVPSHRRTWSSHDNSIHKTVIKEGDLNSSRPRFGASGEIIISHVKIVELADDDKIGDESVSKYFNGHGTAEFVIGTAMTAIDRAFETSLQSFLPGEVSDVSFNVFIEQKYNQKIKTCAEPYWATIACEITLKTLTNADPLYKWYPETKLNKGKDMYAEGVELFKLGRYLDAFHFFQWAYKLSVFSVGIQKTEKHPGDQTAPEIVSEAKKFRISCCNNLAACHFQWNNFKHVVDLSSIVLKQDPYLMKALYRRGVSYLGLNEFDLAEKDLVAAHKLDPNNRAVNEKLGHVKQKRKASQAEMTKNLSKMFA